MKFLVKNESRGARLIQVSRQGKDVSKHVSLGAGEERVLELAAHVARRHADASARNPGRYMRITPQDDDARAALAGTPVPPAGEVVAATAPEAQQEVPPVRTNAAAAAELAGRVEGTDINELRSEARLVLGDRWPRNAGNIRREQIKEMLLAAAAQE